MESSTLNSLLGSTFHTIPMVREEFPSTECIPFKIPLGIVTIDVNDRYAGDGIVHPNTHLFKLTELYDLLKLAGMTRDEVMRKSFSLSLKEKAWEWYRLLNISHLLDWEELKSLFYSKFYPLHEVRENRNYIYNFYPRDGESITLAWGGLKSLMIKCPDHGLSEEMIITKFYARICRRDKEMLDGSSMGSFTNKKIEAKWDLVGKIQRNSEDWEIDK